MYQQIIGADIGRCEVKLCSNGDIVRFPARVGEWQQREISSGGNYEVEIDGEKWFVGELALLIGLGWLERKTASLSKQHGGGGAENS